MKFTLDNVTPLKEALDTLAASNPLYAHAREQALAMGSGEETPILVTPDQLLGNATACGSQDTPCFDRKVIDFLKAQGVERLVVCVEDWEGWTLEELAEGRAGDYIPNLVIAGGAVPIPYEGECPDYAAWLSQDTIDSMGYDKFDIPSPAQVLECMIGERAGSWRCDCFTGEKGWSSYESE